jgi:hypothetical protein
MHHQLHEWRQEQDRCHQWWQWKDIISSNILTTIRIFPFRSCNKNEAYWVPRFHGDCCEFSDRTGHVSVVFFALALERSPRDNKILFKNNRH